MSISGLYIHIPFCEKVCDYCDFSVFSSPPHLHEEYIELLLREIELRTEKDPFLFNSLQTLYLGGGTPSVLSSLLLEKLLKNLENWGVPFRELQEFSMEMNPESCTEEKFLTAKAYGLNRVSLGLQTLENSLLALIGRKHNAQTGLKALELLLDFQKRYGIQINADLMFSLPSQTPEQFFRDAEILASSGIGHVSFYGLSLSKHTLMYNRVRQGKISVSEDDYAKMYLGGTRIFENAGFSRYEVSNFAKPGEESIHNLNYWKRGSYVGFGPSAHSFDGVVRYAVPKNYAAWRRWIHEGCPESGLEKDILGKREKIVELIWLSLRQSSGLNLESLQKESITLSENIMDAWVQKKYAEFNANHFRLTGEGFIFMDSIVESLLPD